MVKPGIPMRENLNKKFMRQAIKEAGKNLSGDYGGPFGACIVRNGKVIALGRNSVLKTDATSHAEINAIRKASKKLKTFDLSGCVIYSTTEPCPMCFSAIHWAKISTLIFGTTILDSKKRGFNELSISSRLMKKAGRARFKLIRGFMRKDCLKLLEDWDRLEKKSIY